MPQIDYGAPRWPTIDPGLLRTPVTIQSFQLANPPTFGNSGQQGSWQPVCSAMALIEELRGTDLIRAGLDVTKLWMTITIRYQPGIQPAMQVVAPDYRVNPPGQDTFVIQAVKDLDRRRVLLELTCLALGQNT